MTTSRPTSLLFFHDTNTTATEVSRASHAQRPLELLSLPEPSLALLLPPSVTLTGSDEQIHMDETIVKLCEEQLQLRSERLFAGTAGTKLDKIAFLMYPPSQVAKVTLITRYLQAVGATVINVETLGSWRDFLKSLKTG